jgi:hypothetical protein
MEDRTKTNLTNQSIWVRLIYMVVLSIAYAVAEAVIFVVAIFQFLVALITGQINRLLHEFSANLAMYIYQIVQFETFNSEEKPFPFSDWPDVEPGETPWRGTAATTAVEEEQEEEQEVEPEPELESESEADEAARELDGDKPNA